MGPCKRGSVRTYTRMQYTLTTAMGTLRLHFLTRIVTIAVGSMTPRSLTQLDGSATA